MITQHENPGSNRHSRFNQFVAVLLTGVFTLTGPPFDIISLPSVYGQTVAPVTEHAGAGKVPVVPLDPKSQTLAGSVTPPLPHQHTQSLNSGPLSQATHDHDEGPHPDDPSRRHEHQAALALVAHENATHRVNANCNPCNWSDANTWEVFDSNTQTWVAGEAPVTEANIWIQENTTVVVDVVDTTVYRTIRVDGTLQFSTTQDSGLMVDTLVVSPEGTFQMGTEENPIPADVEAKLIIADRGEIDTDWDPNLLSRGVISHGTFRMYGAEKTGKMELEVPPRRGDTELMLSSVPPNWKVGDRIILPGTYRHGTQDEELEILGIFGNEVQVSPLKYNHVPPAGQPTYLINVSRNAVIESENPVDIGQRGHVMFMHNRDVKVFNAGFYGLGRTDKREEVDDPLLDENGKLTDGTGDNPRGRYSVHFHRHGVEPGHEPSIVKGSAVVDSPGWGFVNHSSHVVFEANVAFDVIGAAFVTEAGDETGAFRGNIALKGTGSRQGIESREDNQDFGHQGDGFWFQGGGVEVVDNVAIGQRHAGFVYFTRGLDQEGIGKTKFLAANLWDPSIALDRNGNPREFVSVGEVPIKLFQGNTTYASGVGMETWFHLLKARHQVRSVIEDFTAWNLRRTLGMFTPYTNQTTIRNAHLVAGNSRAWGTGVGRNNVTRNIRYENMHVEGFDIGISIPVQGTNVVEGGYFNNIRSIYISTARNRNRVVELNGDIQFGTMTHTMRRGRKQYDIYLRANFNLKDRDIEKLFNPDRIRLGTVKYNGKQIYYHAQAANFVPFPAETAAHYVPPELLNKTNQELWDEFGLAIGGVVAPPNPIIDSRINGLIGDPAQYLPYLRMRSRKYTNQLFNYQLRWRDENGKNHFHPERINLREGWNLLTVIIEGQKRTFFAFGDITPPSFLPSTRTPLVINPADLARGFTLRGRIFDDSFGSKGFRRKFRRLDRLPIQTKPDGTQFVMLEFQIRDRAGNRTTVSLELVVDPDAPLQGHKTPRRKRTKTPTRTLLALLGFRQFRNLLSPLRVGL